MGASQSLAYFRRNKEEEEVLQRRKREARSIHVVKDILFWLILLTEIHTATALRKSLFSLTKGCDPEF